MHDNIDYENMGFKYKIGLFPNEERAIRVYNFAMQLEDTNIYPIWDKEAFESDAYHVSLHLQDITASEKQELEEFLTYLEAKVMARRKEDSYALKQGVTKYLSQLNKGEKD